MKFCSRLSGQIAHGLVVCLLVSCAETLAGQAQQAETTAPPGSAQAQTSATPAPGASQSSAPTSSSSPPSPSQADDQTQRPAQSVASQPAGAQEPVGTAAAPYESVAGVPASRPAGAAIAPGKQRRVRSILIRVGLIVAAGAAIGTVIALSNASPSRPH